MNVIKEINSGTKYSHKVLIEELQQALNKKIDESKNNNLNIFELKKELKDMIDEMIVIRFTNSVTIGPLSETIIHTPPILGGIVSSANAPVFELRGTTNYAVTSSTQMLQDRITALESNIMNIEEIIDRL